MLALKLNKVRVLQTKAAISVVFDQTGADFLVKSEIVPENSFVLASRGEHFWINLSIIIHWIGGLVLSKSIFLRGVSKENSFSSLKSFFKDLYFRAVIKSLRPKVVVTLIDNSRSFHWLSRNTPGPNFIAIQNGARWPMDKLREPLPTDSFRFFSMPTLLCHGTYDKEQCQLYGHKIDQIFPIGSIYMSFFREKLMKPSIPKTFDFCIVSQFDVDHFGRPTMPELIKSQTHLLKFLKRFCDENLQSRVCIALRGDDLEGREAHFFRGQFDGELTLLPNNREKLSSYQTIENSHIIFSQDSSLAREAFGIGYKVLFCNFSGFSNYNFPIEGPWSTCLLDYSEFSKKLKYLLELESNDYLDLSSTARNYIMTPEIQGYAHVVARDYILSVLK